MRGFLIFANTNQQQIEANILAKNILKIQKYPVSVCYHKTKNNIDDSLFDNVIKMNWKKINSYDSIKLYHVTPYEQTIQLSSNFILPKSIDHLWEYLEKFPLTLSKSLAGKINPLIYLK